MINDYLKQYFRERCINQRDIENKTGLKQSKISLILNGKRKLTAEELIKIAIVYDVDLNAIKKEIITATKQ